ncbi:hypothetical protein NDU88_001001 [Pleurodeles waltl]|uniref:Uncharacterized protein n=1 Tax=Pleurodeles waltl TaxID=8319 RepID=A0AAV7Q307_PLEWA|nr:hypothetical protein NDU88_001001 [Pleurodeles waltl]
MDVSDQGMDDDEEDVERLAASIYWSDVGCMSEQDARALEKRKLLTLPMPGCHGDESVVRWQLRGAGKREALILVTGINITTINYGLVLLIL